MTEPSDREAALAAEYALGLASGKDAREAAKMASTEAKVVIGGSGDVALAVER